ncbi:MAG: tRNA pseudouridine(38-40) synthase TruA [Holosporales bacterium]|jgi:tRNA pseudouridine38-40 synthase|nr:tRNA pseudouridine(38-40) synthase TruA [Holosporales bacterium]
MRIKLTIEYNGAGFCGWQRQRERITVQETLEQAIYHVLGNEEMVSLYGAGRTDTGVHATGQIAHFDITGGVLADKWRANINKLTPAINFYLIDTAISVHAAEIVSDDFHSRFSAKMRSYRYVIYNRKVRSVIYDTISWHIPRKLDEILMHEAALSLLGTHDLRSFCSSNCAKINTKRTTSSISIARDNDFVIVTIGAKSFLHNQVRIIVGTLVQIGLAKHQPSLMQYLLESQDRTQAGPTAPPHGLFLDKIEYE